MNLVLRVRQQAREAAEKALAPRSAAVQCPKAFCAPVCSGVVSALFFGNWGRQKTRCFLQVAPEIACAEGGCGEGRFFHRACSRNALVGVGWVCHGAPGGLWRRGCREIAPGSGFEGICVCGGTSVGGTSLFIVSHFSQDCLRCEAKNARCGAAAPASQFCPARCV